MAKADHTFLKELKASGRLPSPTGVALTILELTRNPETSTEDMAIVLHGDPSLSGQILKYANAADSGSRTEITTINDALVRLGMAMVRQLCLGFSLLSNARSGPCDRFDYQRYWTRSLATAVSCQALSKKISSVSPDEGFTCGLLGHIGSLALASVYPPEYSEILDSWNGGSNQDLHHLEEERLSLNHHQVTAAVFEDWGLPDFYQEAVLRQGDLEWLELPAENGQLSRAQKLANLLNIADLAAEICLEEGPERHRLVLDFLKIGESFGYDETAWIALYDEILAEWARMGRVLDILTSSVPAMENLVRRAKAYDKPLKDTGGAPDLAGEAGESEGHQDGRAGTPAKDGLEILLVTDSKTDMLRWQKTLAKEGHFVSTATDGREGLNTALQTNPQLILADWVMPEIDGLELCRTLRQSEQAGRSHFFIMTSNTSNDELEEAYDAGIDDCLAKPLNKRILSAKVKAVQRYVKLQVQAERDAKELRGKYKELSIERRKVKAAYETMERQAMEDQLTELPNRRAGLKRLDEEWAKAGRDKSPMLVMIADIDKFKNVNDKYGHDAGDVVLKKTAAIMRNTLREYDLICRFGGEEFLLVCPGADIKVANMLGDRIRGAVENNHIETPEFTGHVTVSIGVSIRQPEHETPQDMIKESDLALYAAKDNGRNRVCISA